MSNDNVIDLEEKRKKNMEPWQICSSCGKVHEIDQWDIELDKRGRKPKNSGFLVCTACREVQEDTILSPYLKIGEESLILAMPIEELMAQYVPTDDKSFIFSWGTCFENTLKTVSQRAEIDIEKVGV